MHISTSDLTLQEALGEPLRSAKYVSIHMADGNRYNVTDENTAIAVGKGFVLVIDGKSRSYFPTSQIVRFEIDEG